MKYCIFDLMNHIGIVQREFAFWTVFREEPEIERPDVTNRLVSTELKPINSNQ